MTAKAMIIAGTHSGSGKTTIALGLMAALARRGHTVQPFKCGPDFIDPSLHKLVTGITSRNLDCWMAGEDFTRHSFQCHGKGADISIIEGVMGMYDGGDSSSAALAHFLGVPVVLVLDVQSAAESAAAVLKGFESVDPQVAPKGVILNRIASERHLELVSEAINEHCQAEILGYIPRTLNFSMSERHLGLHMGDENPLSSEAISQLAETIAEHVDLDRFMELATLSVPVQHDESPQVEVTVNVRIAVARDKAFCFYYEDNLDLLRKNGAELVFFSPLADHVLPADIQAIYLGGGYPELYARQLAENKSMLIALRQWAEDDGPIYAECGGFMYLSQGILDHDGQQHAMAGVFPVQSRMESRRASLGYREIYLQQESFFGPAGTIMRGHEFHYSLIDEMPAEIGRVYRVNNGTEEGYRYKNVLGGYMHLHFGYSPQVTAQFIKQIGF